MKFSFSHLFFLFVVFGLANPDLAFSRPKEKKRPLQSKSSSSDGNIRDENYAFENGDMAKKQIEQQKGIKVLEQANKLNQKPLDPIR